MLDELHVSHIALIDDATITFAPGLTALTGETGAGKTAMLSALGLVRGERADSAVVREGCDEAVVEARVVEDGAERVVRRRLSAKGRSRCSIDGEMATVGELARAVSGVRVHGQRETSRLLDPAVQLSFLDAWADPGLSALAAYREAREGFLRARRELDAFEKARSAAVRELEFMRYTVEQIEKVGPGEGEYEQLEEELPRLQHAEQLAAAVNAAQQALHADGAVLDMLAEASRGLEREAGIDAELDGIAARLDEAQVQLSDVGRDLSGYAAGLSFDPYRLQEVLGRLDELQALMQRFGPTMDDVLAAADAARRGMDAADASPHRERELREHLEAARERYRDAAEALSGSRHDRAPAFCRMLAESVEELAMKGVGFEFSFGQLPLESWTDDGPEQVELMYSPSAASTPRPLARIASGGELSRFSLALECMHHDGCARDGARARETFVFDEIDQGVGGATGAAVARRLAQLAEHAQVVVVTHLPQVAALADVHYVIEKEDLADALPNTRVFPVRGAEREAEIARMLAGTVDETALGHARVLLADAGGQAGFPYGDGTERTL